MSALFTKSKKGAEETVLVVDIESGSVAAALVALSPGEPPKLFAEHRVMLPMAKSIDAAVLAKQIEKAARAAISVPSLFAARLRNAPGAKLKTKNMGAVTRASIFFAPPWVALEARHGVLAWSREDSLASSLRQEIDAAFGSIPISEYAFGEAAAGTLASLFEQPDEVLLCTITGEMAELLRLYKGAPQGHATIPGGSRLLLRTLGTHAGLSTHEAHSALALSLQREPSYLREPLAASALHFCRQFGSAAGAMGAAGPVHEILILAPEPTGEWFAQALSRAPLSSPFDSESRVRALHTHHLAPHIASHTSKPDLTLMVEGIFMSAL